MTTPLEQANEKRTFWKIIVGIATAVGVVIAVITKGKIHPVKRG